jgi:hypothetical protein
MALKLLTRKEWHSALYTFFIVNTSLCASGCGKDENPAKQHLARPAAASDSEHGSASTKQEPSAQPRETAPSLKSKAQPASAAKSPTPDFTMSAQEFLDEYKRDRKAAQKKYDEAIIQVTGVVHHIGRTFRKEPWVILTQREGKETDSDGVRCGLSNKQAWTKVQAGQKITLKGKCDSLGDLLSCELVDPGPSQSIVLSSEDLAKECTKDWEAATEKYHELYLIVEGEVIGKEFPYHNTIVDLSLKGDGRRKVICRFDGGDAGEELGPVKTGMHVKVFGWYHRSAQGKDYVFLALCFLVEPPK